MAVPNNDSGDISPTATPAPAEPSNSDVYERDIEKGETRGRGRRRENGKTGNNGNDDDEDDDLDDAIIDEELSGDDNHHVDPDDHLTEADLDASPRPRRRKQSFWERDDDQRRKIGIYQRSLRITWQWFPVTMSTGAMASLIGQQPFKFRGLMAIGAIFYIVNLVCFVTFLGLIIARFARKRHAFLTSLHHPSESFFFGAFWVSVALVINGMQVYGVPHCGPWLIKAIRVIYWLYFALATCVAIFQYHIIFHAEKLTLSDAMPAWILPAYPFLVTGVISASIAKDQPSHSAIQILIGGIVGQGLGWILALFIYTVYLTRLMGSKMPPESARPGLYISVGPAAYTCAGILSLGQQAKTVIPPDYLADVSVPIGQLWYIMSVPIGLFLWLICMWFSSVASLSIIRGIPKMSFSLSWWAFVFPNAGMAIATIQIGTALGSFGVKVAGVVITIILVPLWFLCAIMHIVSIWRKDLLAPGKDIGVDDVNSAHDRYKRIQAEKKKRNELKRQQAADKLQESLQVATDKSKQTKDKANGKTPREGQSEKTD
ncbi:hypothetical protein K4F52_004936 [Lecanicillium sp. MT-2017a]|nr:hypothetical protein K4F52_004936 [Lecanicillium sp. MT-2017a]